ncbi:hypothetical protein AYI68_g2230 [Smittium mucronatum]|uniref:Uncharacterized protein n=1 Tax=Smittium mucronatum TaxID=133383 RepID=A0A1R0H3F9_9FUNG|nr:hypothetical protein AYI68_g2230 [Smittium mucronatum]
MSCAAFLKDENYLNSSKKFKVIRVSAFGNQLSSLFGVDPIIWFANSYKIDPESLSRAKNSHLLALPRENFLLEAQNSIRNFFEGKWFFMSLKSEAPNSSFTNLNSNNPSGSYVVSRIEPLNIPIASNRQKTKANSILEFFLNETVHHEERYLNEYIGNIQEESFSDQALYSEDIPEELDIDDSFIDDLIFNFDSIGLYDYNQPIDCDNWAQSFFPSSSPNSYSKFPENSIQLPPEVKLIQEDIDFSDLLFDEFFLSDQELLDADKALTVPSHVIETGSDALETISDVSEITSSRNDKSYLIKTPNTQLDYTTNHHQNSKIHQSLEWSALSSKILGSAKSIPPKSVSTCDGFFEGVLEYSNSKSTIKNSSRYHDSELYKTKKIYIKKVSRKRSKPGASSKFIQNTLNINKLCNVYPISHDSFSFDYPKKSFYPLKTENRKDGPNIYPYITPSKKPSKNKKLLRNQKLTQYGFSSIRTHKSNLNKRNTSPSIKDDSISDINSPKSLLFKMPQNKTFENLQIKIPPQEINSLQVGSNNSNVSFYKTPIKFDLSGDILKKNNTNRKNNITSIKNYFKYCGSEESKKSVLIFDTPAKSNFIRPNSNFNPYPSPDIKSLTNFSKAIIANVLSVSQNSSKNSDFTPIKETPPLDTIDIVPESTRHDPSLLISSDTNGKSDLSKLIEVKKLMDSSYFSSDHSSDNLENSHSFMEPFVKIVNEHLPTDFTNFTSSKNDFKFHVPSSIKKK